MKDKKLNFKEFLQENGVDTKLFAKNCLKENQRMPNLHTGIHDLGTALPDSWVMEAFRWTASIQTIDFMLIDTKWTEALNCFAPEDVTFGFVKYSLGDLYER